MIENNLKSIGHIRLARIDACGKFNIFHHNCLFEKSEIITSAKVFEKQLGMPWIFLVVARHHRILNGKVLESQ